MSLCVLVKVVYEFIAGSLVWFKSTRFPFCPWQDQMGSKATWMCAAGLRRARGADDGSLAPYEREREGERERERARGNNREPDCLFQIPSTGQIITCSVMQKAIPMTTFRFPQGVFHKGRPLRGNTPVFHHCGVFLHLQRLGFYANLQGSQPRQFGACQDWGYVSKQRTPNHGFLLVPFGTNQTRESSSPLRPINGEIWPKTI